MYLSNQQVGCVSAGIGSIVPLQGGVHIDGYVSDAWFVCITFGRESEAEALVDLEGAFHADTGSRAKATTIVLMSKNTELVVASRQNFCLKCELVRLLSSMPALLARVLFSIERKMMFGPALKSICSFDRIINGKSIWPQSLMVPVAVDISCEDSRKEGGRGDRLGTRAAALT